MIKTTLIKEHLGIDAYIETGQCFSCYSVSFPLYFRFGCFSMKI